MNRVECVYFIVHHGLASRILRFARNHKVSGGTIFYGTGTAKNFWLDIFELSHTEKEVLVMVAQQGHAFRLMKMLNKELALEKTNHGITFSIPVRQFTGGIHETDLEEEKEEVAIMYHAITVIVNKGKAEDVLEVAQSAGARGGTIINARGAGRHETSRIFLMEIEPEKELLLILTEKEKTDAIVNAINEKMELDKEGKGVLFVQEVSKAYGIYRGGQ